MPTRFTRIAVLVGALALFTLSAPGVEAATCGDGKKEGNEECEPTLPLRNASCIENGDKGAYTGGDIFCASTCTYDFSKCEKAATTPTGGSGDGGSGDATPAPTGSTTGKFFGNTRPASEIVKPAEVIDTTGRVNAVGLSGIIRRITTAKGLTGYLLSFVLSFLGIVSLLILVLAGFRYVTSFGGDTAKAKGAIVNVIIGIVVILAAWAIVTTVINFGAGPPV